MYPFLKNNHAHYPPAKSGNNLSRAGRKIGLFTLAALIFIVCVNAAGTGYSTAASKLTASPASPPRLPMSARNIIYPRGRASYTLTR